MATSTLFDWLRQNPDADPQQQQAAYSVFNNIDNSVPAAQVQAQPDAQPQDSQDSGNGSVLSNIGDWFSMDSTPQTEGYENAPEGTFVPQSNSTAGGFLSNLSNLFSNPAFLQSAMAFDAGMRGDQQGLQSNLNAYSQTMEARRQEQSKLQQAKLARAQQLSDVADERAWKDRAAQNDSLYRMYTPESVQAYLNSGSTDTSLLKQQPLTPYQQAVIDINQQKADTSQNAVDARVASNAAKNLQNLPTAFGDDSDHKPYQDNNGTWYVNEPNSKGQYTGYKVAGPQLQKQLSANKSSNIPSAGEQQMNSDLQYLYDQNEKGNTGSFTGQAVGRSELAQDISSSVFGDDSARQAYRSAQRIDGMMLSQGVADAKNMGASGINTKAEAEMYFRSMPRLDYTSPAALKTSIEQINAYTKQFNSAKRTSPTAQGVTNSIPIPTGSNSAPSRSSIPSGWSVTRN